MYLGSFLPFVVLSSSLLSPLSLRATLDLTETSPLGSIPDDNHCGGSKD